MQNPITHTKNSIAYYLGGWLLVALLQWLLTLFLTEVPWALALVDALLFNILFALFFIATWPLVVYSGLEKSNLLNSLVSHLVGGGILIAGATLAGWQLAQWLLGSYVEYRLFLAQSLPWRVVAGVIFYLLMVLNLYVWVYNASFKQRKVEEAELKRLLKEAELERLKSQLNPHFIFNSLNSVSSLTVTNPAKAQDMILALSAFLRHALEATSNQLIPLQQELTAIEQFIKIEKVRFGERLQVTMHIPEACQSLLLPAMIVQPLVENAIKFGVHESFGKGSITLEANCHSNSLQITVKNSFDTDTSNRVTTGIGLTNVRERLQILYGSLGSLHTKIENNMYLAMLTIPQL